jgi:hypothetical protein
LDDGKYQGQYLYNEIDELTTTEKNRQSKSFEEVEQYQKGSITINIQIFFYCFLSIYFYRKLE